MYWIAPLFAGVHANLPLTPHVRLGPDQHYGEVRAILAKLQEGVEFEISNTTNHQINQVSLRESNTVLYWVTHHFWVDFDLDIPLMLWSCSSDNSIYVSSSSAQAESGRLWSSQNQSQPNRGPRRDGPPCTEMENRECMRLPDIILPGLAWLLLSKKYILYLPSLNKFHTF